jgi:hypothetical protein
MPSATVNYFCGYELYETFEGTTAYRECLGKGSVLVENIPIQATAQEVREYALQTIKCLDKYLKRNPHSSITILLTALNPMHIPPPPKTGTGFLPVDEDSMF